jgi:hypothetical protein
MQNSGCTEHVTKTGILRPRFAICLSLTLILAGCSGDINPVRDAFSAVGAGPPKVDAPDFVKQTRPQNATYMPIGVSAPERPMKVRNPEQTRQFEAELEALRARNAAQGQTAKSMGATPPPSVPVIAR